MSRSPRNASTAHDTRRKFLGLAGKLAATSALAGVVVPHVHAAGDETIKLAVIGCGGRGSGAVANALSVPGGPVKLFAMADLFEDRLRASHQTLSKQFGERIDVPPERRFIGFDAYRKAIDCLGSGDVAMLTGYTAFRPTQLDYAVEKGVHVFMEKPFAPDPVGVRQIIQDPRPVFGDLSRPGGRAIRTTSTATNCGIVVQGGEVEMAAAVPIAYFNTASNSW